MFYANLYQSYPKFDDFEDYEDMSKSQLVLEWGKNKYGKIKLSYTFSLAD